MKLSDFVGNQRIQQYFESAIQTGRLAHAYLFSGQTGLGKSTLARILCKTLLCRQATADGFCGECPSCHKFDSGNHPDFHLCQPDGLYFKIELVRQIIHQTSLKPVESTWKTFLLEDVDFMREEAANAFLKVLEEPPGQTILLLISNRSEVLLPTIRSRCQNFEFQPLQMEEVRRWLIHRGYPEEDAGMLARYSHGSIGRALTLNASEYKEMRDRVWTVLEMSLLPGSYYQLFDAIRSMTVERKEMLERLLILEELIRDLILLHSSTDAVLIHNDLRDRMIQVVDLSDARNLKLFYDRFLETREVILKVNANISLSLQALFLSLRIMQPDVVVAG